MMTTVHPSLSPPPESLSAISPSPNLISCPEPTNSFQARNRTRRKLSLLGRCLLLLLGELVANVLLWGVALGLFAGDEKKRNILSLCLIAWTLGLRHGLDMDHIVAIDNVTRNLVASGELPVTVGLFFSLGHSTIVVVATIAIVIATSAIKGLQTFSSTGGVIGVSISSSFLILLAIINSAVLWSTLREAKKRRREKSLSPCPEPASDSSASPARLPATTCITRLGRPLFALINKSYKMYPIGLLFGLGFDTASEITLLGISALAQRSSEGIKPSEILVLPLLFASGMTAVDSLDNIGMVWGYSWDRLKGDHKRWKLFVDRKVETEAEMVDVGTLGNFNEEKLLKISTVLTIISIAIALLISITQFMGLALEKCASCSNAAESSPNLNGRWWRFWGSLNDNSGYLGAGVVAIFILVFGGWKGGELVMRRRGARRQGHEIPAVVHEEKQDEKDFV